ncbi:uridine kinase family protein [Ethanoligenens sp.]|uniref:uridine kinase family protein n=1 Tax=Ethanoligenens sp. TaxID=2099655 RepID=UPI0039E92C83
MTAVLPKIRVDDVNFRATDAMAFFQECDARYERELTLIVDQIIQRAGHRQFILLAGPSASGKTTTSLKLKAGLMARGVRTVAISLDDFFKDRADTPLLPDGRPDYESPAALDLDLFTQVTKQLLETEKAMYPVFDFKLAKRGDKVRRLELPQGSVAVVEGLHALNPLVAACLPSERIFRLYVSVSSTFADESGDVLLSAQDVRLVRRVLRDYRFRASSAAHTLELWEGVCRGEDTFIRPFKPLADVTLDTVFPCEPCLFAGMALWHFESAWEDGPHTAEAERLVDAMKRFTRISQRMIPSACLLREFLGGSLYLNKKTLKRRGGGRGRRSSSGKAVVG